MEERKTGNNLTKGLPEAKRGAFSPPLGAHLGRQPSGPRRRFGIFGAARALTGNPGLDRCLIFPGELPICRTAANSEELQGRPPAQNRLERERGLHGRCAGRKERGIFAKHNLDVDFVNFGGSTDQLLEAIATGKADAGWGWPCAGSSRWSKVSTFGSPRCARRLHRLLGSMAANIDSLDSLRGKAIGISDQASPAKNSFRSSCAKKA